MKKKNNIDLQVKEALGGILSSGLPTSWLPTSGLLTSLTSILTVKPVDKS